MTITIILGAQFERDRKWVGGRKRYVAREGGRTFASLFPELVGSELTIDAYGMRMTHLIPLDVVNWLIRNGYFTRGSSVGRRAA